MHFFRFNILIFFISLCLSQLFDNKKIQLQKSHSLKNESLKESNQTFNSKTKNNLFSELATDELIKTINAENNTCNDLTNLNKTISFYILVVDEEDFEYERTYLENANSIDSLLGYLYLSDGSEDMYLKHHNKQKNNKIGQLIKIDSIDYSRYTLVSEKKLDKNNSTELVYQNEFLENKLKNSNILNKILIFVIIMTLIILFFEIVRQKKLKTKYKTKLENLLVQTKENKKTRGIEQTLRHNKLDDSIGIDRSVVASILEKLEDFEDKEHYTKKNITAAKLAKELGTNSNYLGRIIKHHYNTSFRNYINDLRINLVQQKLRNDKNFLNYTVVAIAKEVGFKNSETFAKAFKSKTKLYPSDFIDKLRIK